MLTEGDRLLPNLKMQLQGYIVLVYEEQHDMDTGPYYSHPALVQLGSNGLSQVRCFFAHPFGHHDRLSRRISATGLGSPQTLAQWLLS